MKNLLQFLLFFSVFIFSTPIFSQNKYAIIIGINKYYSSPGVLHKTQLRGCVNDANAIKGMLIKRFNFPDNDNIILLTDKNANRSMVENAIKTILLKVQPGDAFLFYFSGHGVWMNNFSQNEFERKLKMGMNQALVLSDLYADNLKCLFRDADVKQMFNKFVDKKVIATGIFDCCFSGHITQGFSVSMHNPYSFLHTYNSEKSFSFKEIIENYISNNDSIAKFNNPKWDTIISHLIEDTTIQTKAFNLRDSIAIQDSRFITRPSERPHSNFLSISGTDEYQKGEEMKDATGLYHGVFTKSLLEIIDKNPSNISVKDLFDKTKKLIVAKGFKQTPLKFQDPSRLSNNLLGIQSDTFKNSIETKIKSIQKNKIIFDAGITDGLKIGNVLSLKRNKKLAQVQIIAIDNHSCTTRLIKGNYLQLKQKDVFIRTDNFSKTHPLVKLYISLKSISLSQFEKDFQKFVLPLSKLSNYRHYEDWYLMDENQYIFFNKTGFKMDTMQQNILKEKNKNPFFTFLPLPSYLFASFKNQLKQNQNYELVSNPSSADFELYLNYTKDGYVLTWAPFIQPTIKSPKFYAYHLKIKQLPKNSKEKNNLTHQLISYTTQLVQDFTGMWLNDDLRK